MEYCRNVPQNPFDLAEPGEAEENLNNLGLPIKDAVIGQQKVIFDVNASLWACWVDSLECISSN